MSTFLVYVRFWWALSALWHAAETLARMAGNLMAAEPRSAQSFLEEAAAIDEYGREVAGRMIALRDCLAAVQKLEPEETP